MSVAPTASTLTDEQVQQYERDGYLCPVPVLSPAETQRFLAAYNAYSDLNRERLKQLPPRLRYQVLAETHFVLRWVHEIVVHPRILNAVEKILGPNFLAWGTSWFTKTVGDKTFISWHQDGTYWKLSPAKIVTAWVALTPSQPITGCMRIVPGTHLTPLMPQRETSNQDNALSRGQEISVDVREEDAVDLALRPGEMSLHNLWIVHGSNPNRSPDTPRIGLAIRYVSTEVHQDSPNKPLAMLVRGRDTFGNFELLPPPTSANETYDATAHAEIVGRIRNSILAPKPANAPK
jgi:non-heme Fe2+,alpha-ketoglutarate-dependent halogenase